MAMQRMPHCGRRVIDRRCGFSLIEVLAALGLFGVLLALGTPAYSNWIATQQLANHANYLAETLQRARSEAIKHGYRVNVCKTRDRSQCTDHGDWTSGWLMYVDENHNGQLDDDELILHREFAAPDGISVQGNRPIADYVSYTSLGHARLLNGGLQMGTFVVCKSGQNALKVVLANSGRPRIDKTKELCP
ncbi:MAG: prepilin-type N-terminal cleavage/methylation domain-containing protein [Betaproteobacteria bacterium]|nr:MAG: prepilin-type N-terminal cleavage/methylation domain-containing protein [Betaproteobacteria bacterium]